MELRVFTGRWGHDDVYFVERTADGWYIDHIVIGGNCDKTGAPYLFKNLDQDSVIYREDLRSYMEFLWNKAEELDMTEDQIQEQLDIIGQWISQSEKVSLGGIFKECK